MPGTEELIRRIEDFIAGRDISIAAANAIEAALDACSGSDAFSDEFIEDVVTALACYQPGGGEYLFQESELLPLLEKALIGLILGRIGEFRSERRAPAASVERRPTRAVTRPPPSKGRA